MNNGHFCGVQMYSKVIDRGFRTRLWKRCFPNWKQYCLTAVGINCCDNRIRNAAVSREVTAARKIMHGSDFTFRAQRIVYYMPWCHHTSGVSFLKSDVPNFLGLELWASCSINSLTSGLYIWLVHILVPYNSANLNSVQSKTPCFHVFSTPQIVQLSRSWPLVSACSMAALDKLWSMAKKGHAVFAPELLQHTEMDRFHDISWTHSQTEVSSPQPHTAWP